MSSNGRTERPRGRRLARVRETSVLRILIVTSDPELEEELRGALEPGGHEPMVERAAPGSVSAQAAQGASIALYDLRLGTEGLRATAGAVPWTLAIGAPDDPGTVLGAVRSGARDVLGRPPGAAELAAALARAGDELRAREPAAVLHWVGEDERPLSHPLPAGAAVTLGRDHANDVVFDSPVVSRFHARIAHEDGEWVIEDTHSRHGVWREDTRIEGRTPLRHGDRLRLGKAGAPVLTFRTLGPGRSDDEDAAVPTADAYGPSPGRELKDLAGVLDTFLSLNRDLVLDDVLHLVLARSIEFAEAERGLILLAPPDEGGALPASAPSGPVESGPQDRPGGTPPAATPAGEGDGGDRENGEAWTSALVPALGLHRDGRPIDLTKLTISRKIPEQVASTGHGVILGDLLASGEAELHLNTIDIGVRSAMCVPLVARSPREPARQASVIGVLYLDSGSGRRRFPDELLRALESLANEAAQAIVNARLWRISQEKEAIDEEMKIAREIQSNLLPPQDYSSVWVRLRGSSTPSREVGGDVINYWPVGTQRLAFLVGDVSGKGVSAAIFSTMLDGHFLGMSALADPRSELARLSSDFNRYLVEKSQGTKFVSFVFGSLERDGRLVYVNAGHNPPLWTRPDGSVERLETGGRIMGLFEDAEYTTGTAQLAPGDRLVLYSDGITEAKDPEGALFGPERLQETVLAHRHEPAEALHDAVLEAVRRFTGGTPFADDVTLLVVEIRG